MAGVSVGGLASGMDTNTMVTQLMAIERQPLTRLDASRLRAEGRRAAFDELATKMRALLTARADLGGAALWKDVQKVESGDAARVVARKSPNASTDVPAGTYAVTVTQTAQAQQSYFAYTAPDPAGSVSVTIGSGDTQTTVSTAAGRTGIGDVAAAINGDSTLAVYAEVTSAGELLLKAKQTGTAFTATSTELAASATPGQAARQAQFSYSVNGGAAVTPPPSATNTVTIDGLELDLRAPTIAGTPVTVTVGAAGKDVDAIKTKVKAFVDQYNALVDFARAKLSEPKVANPRIAADHAKGALRGDSGLSGVMSGLRIAMSSRVDGVHPDRDTLAELGISVMAPVAGKSDQDRLSGKLVLDEKKLTDAIAAGGNEIRTVLDAVSTRVGALVEPFARTGTGVLATRSQQADGEAGRIRRQYADLEKRLEGREARLRAEFTRMETALAASQSQTQWLSGQLAGLGG